MIKDNLQTVCENIDAALKKAGREAGSCKLIAVSKTKPVSMLMEAYECGIRDFGENYVQELMEKYEELPKDIRWHMIGHLQRNKVKYIVGKTALIHSVDSYRLAEEISKEAVKKQVECDILLEVNVGGETTKFGTSGTDDTMELVRQVAALPGIHIKGLMTSAPYVENAEENRQYFVALRQLSVDIKQKNIDNVCMDILSMGMTNDYIVATEEGATCVRVGTGIFGARDYGNL